MSEWKLVESYGVTTYQCGLQAGQTIALRRDLPLTSEDGPTGEVWPKGDHSTVLRGSQDDPGVIFLRRSDGNRHTWTDSPEIFDCFEIVDDDKSHNPS